MSRASPSSAFACEVLLVCRQPSALETARRNGVAQGRPRGSLVTADALEARRSGACWLEYRVWSEVCYCERERARELEREREGESMSASVLQLV